MESAQSTLVVPMAMAKRSSSNDPGTRLALAVVGMLVLLLFWRSSSAPPEASPEAALEAAPSDVVQPATVPHDFLRARLDVDKEIETWESMVRASLDARSRGGAPASFSPAAPAAPAGMGLLLPVKPRIQQLQQPQQPQQPAKPKRRPKPSRKTSPQAPPVGAPVGALVAAAPVAVPAPPSSIGAALSAAWGNGGSSSRSRSSGKLRRRVMYIKTYKTGSTTVAMFLNAVAFQLHLRALHPADKGWFSVT